MDENKATSSVPTSQDAANVLISMQIVLQPQKHQVFVLVFIQFNTKTQEMQFVTKII